VKSPNPAFSEVDVPLASSFVLSPMQGRGAYVEPVVADGNYTFTVRTGTPSDPAAAKRGTKLSRGAHFACLMSGAPISSDYIKSEGMAGRIGDRLMAIVAEGDRERVYLSPDAWHEAVARVPIPENVPTQELPADDTANFWCTIYGLRRFADLFTPRQLVALTTVSDLITECRERVRADMRTIGLADDQRALHEGGSEATAYADAVATYLTFLVSKLADKGSTLCTWDAGPASNRTASGRSARVATVRVTFGRQALPMTWDFAEANLLSDTVGGIATVLRTLTVPLDYLPNAAKPGHAVQADAQTQHLSRDVIVSTDPPYYDNISYADLSDFFHAWLRRSLRTAFPELLATVAVPKADELIATPYRHGGAEKAEAFFLLGMTEAMRQLANQAHPAFPVTIYYAFKQAETASAEGTASTGWETFLDAVIRAGFSITGTWPVRTELGSRMIGSGTNALASSIVLVCRQHPASATTSTRREFVTALRDELPRALTHLQHGNIAPVDLAQAAIGPGMAVYTRSGGVLDAAGRPLSVRDALALINQTLDEALTEQEGDFDVDSRWALTWFDQYAFAEGPYGEAEVLATARANSVGGLVASGIVTSRGGKVRLLAPDELPAAWDPTDDVRTNIWEMLHHLVRVFEHAGEATAAQLLAKYGPKADVVRELAYRLYTACERRKRAKEAGSYNALVQSWPEIARLAKEGPASAAPRPGAGLFDQE
jgi:putative DNA methylase